MTRFVVVALVVGALLYRFLRRPAARPEPDPMSQPFLDSRNSATYYHNRLTGVTVSAN